MIPKFPKNNYALQSKLNAAMTKLRSDRSVYDPLFNLYYPTADGNGDNASETPELN